MIFREIDDLRRLVSHFIEPRSDAAQAQTNRPPPEITQLQQANLPLQHLTASPQLLPWLLNNGVTPSSPLKLLENLEAARNVNQTQLSSLWSTLQNNSVPTSSSANTVDLSHAVAASINNSNIQRN